MHRELCLAALVDEGCDCLPQEVTTGHPEGEALKQPPSNARDGGHEGGAWKQ